MVKITSEMLAYHLYFCIFAGEFFITLLILKAGLWLFDLVGAAMDKHIK